MKREVVDCDTCGAENLKATEYTEISFNDDAYLGTIDFCTGCAGAKLEQLVRRMTGEQMRQWIEEIQFERERSSRPRLPL